MRIENDGELSFDDVLDRFSRIDEAAVQLDGWGWQQGAFRTLGCASPPDGEVGWVEIVADLFADPVSAQQAVAYFADVRAESGRRTFGPSPGIGDHAVSLAGLASNGNEVTIYASQGPLLVRVTGVAPEGIPFENGRTVAQAVLSTASSSSSTGEGRSRSEPVLPAAAFLPSSPDITHAACFEVLDRGPYAYGDVAGAFQTAGMASEEFDGLGWMDGAYVVFHCDEPPQGRASQIEVVIHQFRDALAARQALPYADNTYQPGENEIRDGDTAGPLVICVTGRSPTGAPLSDVAFVLQQVLADAER